jgi:hypothetical protein
VAAPLVPVENVVIEVEEKLIVTLKKDGGMESMEIQGTMALEVASEDAAFIRLHIAGGANKGFQFKTHPNIDKALHSRENTLGLKDPNRPFPTGSPLGVLKWRMQVGPVRRFAPPSCCGKFAFCLLPAVKKLNVHLSKAHCHATWL